MIDGWFPLLTLGSLTATVAAKDLDYDKLCAAIKETAELRVGHNSVVLVADHFSKHACR